MLEKGVYRNRNLFISNEYVLVYHMNFIILNFVKIDERPSKKLLCCLLLSLIVRLYLLELSIARENIQAFKRAYKINLLMESGVLKIKRNNKLDTCA